MIKFNNSFANTTEQRTIALDLFQLIMAGTWTGSEEDMVKFNKSWLGTFNCYTKLVDTYIRYLAKSYSNNAEIFYIAELKTYINEDLFLSVELQNNFHFLESVTPDLIVFTKDYIDPLKIAPINIYSEE